MSNLRKATRQKAKIRLGLSAVSGGGKTYSALLIAFGLCGDWEKIAVIDTENSSADLYAHLGPYSVLPLSGDYAPEKYINAVRECEAAGMEVIIVDSITHEWDGKGGILNIADGMTGNSFTNWAKLTPRHQGFIDSMLQSKCHVITTVRRKQDYEMSKDRDGKTKVEKMGLKEVTREGFEYELTVNIELDTKHNATASKDRTGLFMGKPSFIPSVETGKMIAEWCESGIDTNEAIIDAITKLHNCKSVDELTLLKEILPNYVVNSDDFKKAGMIRYNQITAAKVTIDFTEEVEFTDSEKVDKAAANKSTDKQLSGEKEKNLRELNATIAKLKKCESVDDLKELKKSVPAWVLNTAEFNNAATKRFTEVAKKEIQPMAERKQTA